METKTVWKCQDCDEVTEDKEDLIKLYECPECGQVFSRENSYNDNHQCPDCMKFSSILTTEGCPECQEGECEEVEMVQKEDGDWADPDEYEEDGDEQNTEPSES